MASFGNGPGIPLTKSQVARMGRAVAVPSPSPIAGPMGTVTPALRGWAGIVIARARARVDLRALGRIEEGKEAKPDASQRSETLSASGVGQRAPKLSRS